MLKQKGGVVVPLCTLKKTTEILMGQVSGVQSNLNLVPD